MSDEAKLFQQISNEAAQGIYVIDKKNHDLLYYNENVELFLTGKTMPGVKNATPPCTTNRLPVPSALYQ